MTKKSGMSHSGRVLGRRIARAVVALSVLVGGWSLSIGGSFACAFVLAQVPDTGDCLPPLPGASAPVPDEEPPSSKFHHPKHRGVYPREDYRIRELHVYAADNHGGQGVTSAEAAVRRTSKNGSCAWWDGKQFVPGDCATPTWLEMPAYDRGYFYYYRLPSLKPSNGRKTKVQEYTAFARATDAAGNVEGEFEDGRNVNSFDITKK